ncbi:putative protein serine/threonine kinase [Heterostelium album PN500]|uniref:non-specific serine/threonine protein kinase n=1 Tax=Heterostelium pallidum (strain ATCC 26659 / Pp 5 / PN500) TaxID=670386 RepID=D3BJI2_HETP5|nr:putative protein serine/threonine kinase [Heterostelium album PN500]EFA78062.1 putative protein serine/threonine kinase [Heterostelium album PN500]|eukprot:XP_020430189.1 putative protein serine/threonine kinase [Heterostelium album PN500]
MNHQNDNDDVSTSSVNDNDNSSVQLQQHSSISDEVKNNNNNNNNNISGEASGSSISSNTTQNAVDLKHLLQSAVSSNDISFSPMISSPNNSSPSIAPKKKTIDDFTIGKVLGEGSYGAVVLGTDKETSIQYAIKILEKKHILKENKAKYVQIEKEILCRANHPNICKLYFTFRSENCLYYVLELCSQGDLLHHIKPVGSFNDQCTKFYTAEIISALEHLHGIGIVHRDLKPENILLADDMHIKVTDFGTGKIIGNATKNNNTNTNTTNETTAPATSTPSSPELTRSNSFVGTAEYVSPELINNKETSTESDLWALGCIIYQLSTGRLPFRGKTEFLTFQKISNRELVYPLNMNPVIKDLIEKLLVVNPTDRLGSRTTGFEKLKQHPFFEGIDWENLHRATPPTIAPPTEKIVFEETHDLSASNNSNNNISNNNNSSSNNFNNSNNNVGSNSNNNLSQQSLSSSNGNLGNGLQSGSPTGSSPSNSSPSQQRNSDRAKWAQFLQPNENIVESGLVWKKKGFSIKKRQLILTSQPRLIYIDPKKMELKGEIPWSSSLKPEVKSGSNFVIQTQILTTITLTTAKEKIFIRRR